MVREGSQYAPVFYPSRGRLLMAVLIWLLFGGALLAVPALWRDVAASPWAHYCMFLGYGALTGAAVALTKALRPVPQAVWLDRQGVHLQQADGAESWAWDQVVWRRLRRTGPELAFRPESGGLPLASLGRRERILFWQYVTYYLQLYLGPRQARRLDAGEALRAPATPPGRIALGLLAITLLIIEVVCRYARAEGISAVALWQGLPRADYWPVVVAVALLVVLFWETHNYLRQAGQELAFVPGGVAQRWIGGGTFWRYDQIERVVCDASRVGVHRVTIRVGKTRLHLDSATPHYWGAVHLLRQHVPPERWVEKSVPALSVAG